MLRGMTNLYALMQMNASLRDRTLRYYHAIYYNTCSRLVNFAVGVLLALSIQSEKVGLHQREFWSGIVIGDPYQLCIVQSFLWFRRHRLLTCFGTGILCLYMYIVLTFAPLYTLIPTDSWRWASAFIATHYHGSVLYSFTVGGVLLSIIVTKPNTPNFANYITSSNEVDVINNVAIVVESQFLSDCCRCHSSCTWFTYWQCTGVKNYCLQNHICHLFSRNGVQCQDLLPFFWQHTQFLSCRHGAIVAFLSVGSGPRANGGRPLTGQDSVLCWSGAARANAARRRWMQAIRGSLVHEWPSDHNPTTFVQRWTFEQQSTEWAT